MNFLSWDKNVMLWTTQLRQNIYQTKLIVNTT